MQHAIVPYCHRLLLLAAVNALAGCNEHTPVASDPPDERETTIRYDLTAPFLADVPWPNDSLCWAHETSDGPCKPNLSTVGMSTVLANYTEAINATAGWSNTGRISLPFRRAVDAFAGPAIDLPQLLATQQDSDFADDAIYLIDLDARIPVFLDFSNHLTSFVLQEPFALDPVDPLGEEPSLVVDTMDERYDYVTAGFDPARTVDGTVSGAPVYRAKWDYDSDGLLDVPSYHRGRQCSPAKAGTTTVERDRCLADNLIPSYDVATDTLRIRPRSPLRENAAYAVVVTRRLLDNRQRSVKSPFGIAHHPNQANVAKRLETLLSDPAGQDYFGSLAGTGLSEVAFFWSFTTAAPVAELSRLSQTLTSASASDTAPSVSLSFDDEVALDEACEDGTPRDAVLNLLANTHALTASEQAALAEPLGNLASIRTGTLAHRNFVEFPNGALRARTTPGSSTVHVPFLLALPPRSSYRDSIRTVIVAHDFGTNRLDGLRWAGRLAEFGLASVLLDSPYATQTVEPSTRTALLEFAETRCAAKLMGALLAERSDTSWSAASPLHPDVVATRDLVRTGAIELAQLARGVVDAASDATDGVARLDFTGYVGQGEGAALVSLASTLTPSPAAVVLVDPTTSPDRAWARGTTWGTAKTDRLTLFGPRIVGVAVDDLESADSACSSTSTSLRLVTPNTAPDGEELDCLPLRNSAGARFLDGATVIATNLRSGARRCVALSARGEFSLGLPAETGDGLALDVYEGLEVVSRLGRDSDCDLLEPSTKPVYSFDASQAGEERSLPETSFGLGLERQSSQMRATLAFADAAFALGNPTAFLAELGRDQAGKNATALLVIVSPGDSRVSPDEGLSAAVAAGLIPNLPDDSLLLHPECARDITPTLLSTSLRMPTAESAIAEGHLAEGAPRLARHDPEPLVCGNNWFDTEALASLCLPTCESDSDCSTETHCGALGRCELSVPTAERCAQSLYDLDALADALTETNALRAPYPLRLGRYSGLPERDTLADLWQPRTVAKGISGANAPLHSDWPLSALMLPMASPWGSHGIVADDVCQRFRFGSYVPSVIARYLASNGRSYAPILSWSTQTCLGTDAAPSTCE